MKDLPQAQNPLLLRANRLMDAFSKSNDEKDFYLDRVEGFLIFVDLDKDQEDLNKLEQELLENPERYCEVPKLTLYDTKRIMEGFVNEKVYDIDTKEKLLDIIQSKDSREQFLDFIYDHESEVEKWQQCYQEKSRIKIIEWLRNHDLQFVFEEDLDLPKNIMEQLKVNLFESKVSKEIQQIRQFLASKAKTYYSSEALNPRPKRGRPPKQVIKIEVDTAVYSDIYTQVPSALRRFLYLPEIASTSSITFSERFDTEEAFLFNRQGNKHLDYGKESLSQNFNSLKEMSSKLNLEQAFASMDDDDDDDDDLLEQPVVKKRKTSPKTTKKNKK